MATRYVKPGFENTLRPTTWSNIGVLQGPLEDLFLLIHQFCGNFYPYSSMPRYAEYNSLNRLLLSTLLAPLLRISILPSAATGFQSPIKLRRVLGNLAQVISSWPYVIWTKKPECGSASWSAGEWDSKQAVTHLPDIVCGESDFNNRLRLLTGIDLSSEG